MKILVVSGSLRKESLNTAVAEHMVENAPDGVDTELADISQVPLFNQDSEENFPKVVTDLKEKIRAADGVIIVTPEYNRSLPGVLKNVMDWTSRPYGDNAWEKKPVAVTGATISPVGTALAQYDAKKVLTYLDAYVMGQPELYITAPMSGEGAMDAVKAATPERLAGFVEEFVKHVNVIIK